MIELFTRASRLLGASVIVLAAFGCTSEDGDDNGDGSNPSTANGSVTSSSAASTGAAGATGGTGGEPGTGGQAGGAGGTGGVSELPAVTILQPTAGSTFAIDEIVQFQGTATDPQDGPITETLDLLWQEQGIIDPLAFGESITYSFSEADTKTITLTATDSDGNEGVASVDIIIQ